MSEAYENWVGREESCTELINASSVRAMAATLDWAQSPVVGDPLPSGWQWMFFNPVVARSELGTDGHPKRGGFLPPIELPRRMWAGSRIHYHADLPIGTEATRKSRILSVVNKVGKQGPLWFVTVEHTTSYGDTRCIVEEQDIVYRSIPPAGAVAATPSPYEQQGQWGCDVVPDSTLLFRYSALTFNGHRIHYDQAYTQHEEGYPDLVVHGPMVATLLQQLAVQQGDGKTLAYFEFRGMAPLFVTRGFSLEGLQENDGTLKLWARGPDQELAVLASATFR